MLLILFHERNTKPKTVEDNFTLSVQWSTDENEQPIRSGSFHKRFRRWIRWWCNDKSRNRLRSSGSLRVSSPPPRVLIFLHRKPSTTVHLHGITSLLVTFPFVAKKIGTLQMNFTAYSANWDAVIFSLEILGQSEPVFIATSLTNTTSGKFYVEALEQRN